MDDGTSTPRACEVCDAPLASHNRSGICGNHDSPECMRERKRRDAAARGVKAHRIVIKADDTFGTWTALEDYSPARNRILCRCECGTRRRVNGVYLANGRSRSCGCAPRVRRRPKPPYLRAGAAFARLTLLEDVANCEDAARFHCECGGEITTKAILVKTGGTRSCGCIRREGRTTHGFSKHPLYGTWHGMVQRCTNPKAQSYENYGGRGIAVCEQWLDPWMFAGDIEREIGSRPEGKYANGRALYSLDRWPNNDGNYEPGNVRWSTTSEQVLNQRKVSALTQDVLRVTNERDALAMQVAALEALLARCECRSAVPDAIDVLF